MAFKGADPALLEKAAEVFDRAHHIAAQMTEKLSTTANELTGSEWYTGTDVPDFQTALKAAGTKLQAPTEDLRKFTTELRAQAAEQRRTSMHGGPRADSASGRPRGLDLLLAQLIPPGSKKDTPIVVATIGNSYISGEGAGQGTREGRAEYVDAADRRHRSWLSPVGQALQRLKNKNPGRDFEFVLAASSGAVTENLVVSQVEDGHVVNGPQKFQIPPNADVVVMEWGGNDARFADVLRAAYNPFTTQAEFNRLLDGIQPLLDSTLRDEEYRNQAATSEVGRAPTLVARLLQNFAEVKDRAPNAALIQTTYPVGLDVNAPNNWGPGISRQERALIRDRLALPLNAAIRKAVELSGGSVTLADAATAVAGHEVGTAHPYINNESPAYPPSRDRWGEPSTFGANEAYHPNPQGMGNVATVIAPAIAGRVGIDPPAPAADGTVTRPSTIRLINGVSDLDGDGIPDTQDATPGKPTFKGRVHGLDNPPTR